MKLFLSISAATCALVVAPAQALPGGSSPPRGEYTLSAASPVCLVAPAWFAPIHRYYNCDPKITPNFDFASLYSGSSLSQAEKSTATR